jgi:surface antigen
LIDDRQLEDGVMPNRLALRIGPLSGVAGLLRVSLVAAVVILVSPAHAAEDPRDLSVIMPALNEALENERSGKDISWTNVVTGRAGTIRMERTFYRGQQPCRDYIRTTVGNGPGHEVRGVGCRLGRLNWTVEERSEEPATTAAAAAPAPGAAPSEPPPTAAREPSGDSAQPRPQRKPAAQPTLRYGLPTRSQL